MNTHPYRNLPRDDARATRSGYASLFVDVRGTGGSEGTPTDEYSHQEHLDTDKIIDWLSRQPWCTGKVGMYGASYSAFNALQIAYEMAPTALAAIFLNCGTDDRYTDDIHYPGGAMLMVDNSRALGMLVMNAMPGAPDYVHDSAASLARWNTPPWLQGFLHNQVDGPYWRYGSLAPDYERLRTPTFLVGGTLDIYQNQVLRVMREAINAETRGILGPWHHSLRYPGPAVDLDGIRLRWFDQWLKGEDTGLLDEPRVSFYMPRWRPQSFRFEDDVPGEWRFTDRWPESAYEPAHRLYLTPEPDALRSTTAQAPVAGTTGRLASQPDTAAVHNLDYAPGTGARDQSFGPTGAEGYYGLDRREDDAWSLTFDGPVLREPLEILGFIRAHLFVESSAAVTTWIVRLCDLAPDGSSYLITRGYLNGTHRSSHSNPEPLVPGEVYELDFSLMGTAYRFEPGHRLRVSISNADFPVLWPAPEPMQTRLYSGGERASYVALPELQDLRYRTGKLPVAPSRERPTSSLSVETDDAPWYEYRRDHERGISIARVNLPFSGQIECRVEDARPGYASMSVDTISTERAADREVSIRSKGVLRSTPQQFELDMSAELLEDGKSIRSRRWQDRIPRRLV